MMILGLGRAGRSGDAALDFGVALRRMIPCFTKNMHDCLICLDIYKGMEEGV
jgi:hypothetical protein